VEVQAANTGLREEEYMMELFGREQLRFPYASVAGALLKRESMLKKPARWRSSLGAHEPAGSSRAPEGSTTPVNVFSPSNLILRVFKIDPLVFECGRRFRILSFSIEHKTIRRLLYLKKTALQNMVESDHVPVPASDEAGFTQNLSF
jgi:hypothetical protein